MEVELNGTESQNGQPWKSKHIIYIGTDWNFNLA